MCVRIHMSWSKVPQEPPLAKFVISTLVCSWSQKDSNIDVASGTEHVFH